MCLLEHKFTALYSWNFIPETPNATIFTAVAAKTNISDVIHVEANQRGGMTVLFRRDGRHFEEMNLDLKKTWYLRGKSH